MVSGRATSRLGQLWQFPLLLFSAGIFSYSVYLFADPKPGPSIGQRLEAARIYLKQERAEAAIEQLNILLEEGKLTSAQEGAVRMLLGEGLELGQKQKRLSLPENHRQIIRQTELAVARGIEADAQVHRRLAESYEAIGRAAEAESHYRSAMSLDTEHALKWHRKLIEIQLAHQEMAEAQASLEDYLKRPALTGGERAWAMGQKSHVLIDQGRFAEARQVLADAMKLNPNDPTEQGQFNHWSGYCAWKLGQLAEAERYLRVARDLLRVQHPLDAEAAWTLGRIKQEQGQWAEANSFYGAVLQSHLDSPSAPPSRLGRGNCRIAMGDDEAGLSDLHDVVKHVLEHEGAPPTLKAQTIAALKEAVTLLSARDNYQGGLEVMAYEQQLVSKPDADFFGRLGKVYEQRANQIEAEPGETKAERLSKVRELRKKSGDAFIACSRALTLKDDKGQGLALWKAIELYDAAADLPRVISAIESFTADRPDDPRTPDALLRLGNSCQAAGLYDKAIAAYRGCQFRYPKSLAASKSGVPLARAYIAKGPEFYRRAEESLRAVIENNPQVTPEAEEFEDALVELAHLYYRTGRFELAIARLEEITQRYPADPRMGQLFFIMADSYRKSAVAVEELLRSAESSAATTKPAVDIAEANRARAGRLARARDLYQQVIAYYRVNAPTRDLDKLYLKLSYFYRADCVYDLGNYAEAIRLYDDAAFRYQDDASALAAYVQIVNANVALGRLDEAKAANERAKTMLRRMPRELFDATNFVMPKPAWEQWLQWAGDAGMWKSQ